MKEQAEWVPFQSLEWNDPKFNKFNIDTRDFHAGYQFEKPHPDMDKLKNYPDFFHTEQEIKDLLNRYFTDSGGSDVKWRFFCLEGLNNWGMKYIRIWRTELGFVVCNSDNRAMKKEVLSAKVVKEY